MPNVSLPIFLFTYAYELPGNDLDGETIEVQAANEREAFEKARKTVDFVSPRIGLRLIETRATRMRRSA